MFPEFRELISELKQNNAHFKNLFDKHNQLDHEIKKREHTDRSGYDNDVISLKKEKLRLKDELYELLKNHEHEKA